MKDAQVDALKEPRRVVGDFLKIVLAIALALVLLVLMVWSWRRFVGGEPIELAEYIERLISTHATAATFVNLEYRDADGVLMDLGHFVRGTVHNAVGNTSELHEGYFGNCNPDQIKAGAPVLISIQDGLIKESLWVKLKADKDGLFVQSQFTVAQMLEKINQPRE